MTTQQIHYFLLLAECKSFTETARRLFVAQSTLSKQIALLEDELGLKLFYRNNRMVELTPAGKVFHGSMVNVDANIRAAIERARYMNQGMEGYLSVGILDIINPSLFITPLIQAFRERYPLIEVDVALCGFSGLREALSHGEVDVAFGKAFDLDTVPDLEGMDVYKNYPSIIMNSHHPLAGESVISVAQLKNERFVALTQDECSPSTYTLVDLCGKEGFYPRITKLVSNNVDRVYYASLGLCVSLIDLEYSVPLWADCVKVPLVSDANHVFEGINVRMTWRKS